MFLQKNVNALYFEKKMFLLFHIIAQRIYNFHSNKRLIQIFIVKETLIYQNVILNVERKTYKIMLFLIAIN